MEQLLILNSRGSVYIARRKANLTRRSRISLAVRQIPPDRTIAK